ncbi:MAG: DUF2956 domain-containing protein [Methylococcales bacterium]|nr:DUF2956 domain-containing protein [Methylococcales bacterium]
MSSKYKSQISTETETEAMKIARATQRPQQTKEHTKLITQGIEKGIAQYKKQQKMKNRESDKHRKQVIKTKQTPIETVVPVNHSKAHLIPWFLLGATWLAIALYTLTQNELF